MTKLPFALLLTAVLAWPQIGAPRLGFVRTTDGTVRPLIGVAGSFTLGKPVLQGVEHLWFDGRRGVALTAVERIDLDAAGQEHRRSEIDEAIRFPDPGAAWSADEVVIAKTGVRMRVPFAVESVERVGAEYLLVEGGTERRLLRTSPGHEALYEMPEADE
jgi:hypothetical protein